LFSFTSSAIHLSNDATPSTTGIESHKYSKYEKKRKQMIIHADHCDAARADRISFSIMKFVAGCGLAMLTEESVFFLEMLRELNGVFVERYLSKADAFTRTWLPKLYKLVELQIELLWEGECDVLRTLGIDGFATEAGEKVFNVTEAIGDKVAFKVCIEQGENRVNAEFIMADTYMEQMQSTAQLKGVEVEDLYAAVVGDNVAVNCAAFKLIEEMYPKIIGNGCRTHCTDLLSEDPAKIPEIEIFIKDAKFMSKFVQSHDVAKAAFKRIIKSKGGVMLKLFLIQGSPTQTKCLIHFLVLMEKMLNASPFLSLSQHGQQAHP
jgi:hypothetical protein